MNERERDILLEHSPNTFSFIYHSNAYESLYIRQRQGKIHTVHISGINYIYFVAVMVSTKLKSEWIFPSIFSHIYININIYCKYIYNFFLLFSLRFISQENNKCTFNKRSNVDATHTKKQSTLVPKLFKMCTHTHTLHTQAYILSLAIFFFVLVSFSQYIVYTVRVHTFILSLNTVLSQFSVLQIIIVDIRLKKFTAKQHSHRWKNIDK